MGWELTDTNVFAQTVKYTGMNRAELNFTAYSATSTYAVGDLVSNGTTQYVCKTAITVAEAFTPSKWYSIGEKYDIYNLALPYPLFDLQGNYKIGDNVFWEGKVYTALRNTGKVSQTAELQSIYQSEVQWANVFPDDPKQGKNYWGTGQAYSVTGLAPGIPVADYSAWAIGTTYGSGDKVKYTIEGVDILFISQKASNTGITPGTDITAWLPFTWAAGDNRDQLIVDFLLALVIYDIQSRIMPDNISETRKTAREYAIQCLNALAHGDLNSDMIVKYETFKGLTTSFGGITKTTNTW